MPVKHAQSAANEYTAAEIVELNGHIIDSLLLPKIMDEILTRGGLYELQQIDVGMKPTDPSYARIKVLARSTAELEDILEVIHDHGATAISEEDAAIEPADMDGAFTESFYSTTNHLTQIRVKGKWVTVADCFETRDVDLKPILDLEAKEGLVSK